MIFFNIKGRLRKCVVTKSKKNGLEYRNKVLQKGRISFEKLSLKTMIHRRTRAIWKLKLCEIII